MAPKHQPAMVKMTLKAAAILSLLPGSLRLCDQHLLFCSRCLVTWEAGYPMLTADVRSWSPLASLEAGSSVTSAAQQRRQCGNRGCHPTLATTIYCVSRQWSTSCIVIWGTGLVHRWFISTLTTKKHDTYWLTLLFLFLVWVTLLFFWAPPSKFVCWKALRPGVSSPCQAWSSPRTFPRPVCDHLLTPLGNFYETSLLILSLIYLAHYHSEVYSQ